MSDALLQHLTRGFSALESNAFAEAVTAFEAAHALLPADAGVCQALANAQQLAGDVLGARATLEGATAHATGWTTEQRHEIATALLALGSPVAAAALFETVVDDRPRDPAALGAWAAALRGAGDVEYAWSLIKRATKLAPNAPALLFTAAQVCHDRGALDDADRWIDKARRVRPDHAPTRLQAAYTSLLRRANATGWELFEARPLPVPDNGSRPWHGDALHGASILVTAEQGVGDQFQFVRFVPLLAARGAGQVVVQCHPQAVPLFRANGLDAVPRGETPATSWHVPMMSLPHRLGLDSDVQGALVPYMKAPGPAVERRANHPARVGIVWAGNPEFTGRATRDLDPAQLAALVAPLEYRAIEWISLQHGRAADGAPAGIHQAALSSSWADTANVLRSLDVLVSTDTGIVHLAGAMGIPTIVLLQFVPDWRWGLHETTTAWYPSHQLARQRQPGDWAGAVREARAILATRLPSTAA